MAGKRRRKISARRLNLRRLVVCACLLGAAALAVKTAHRFGDAETRETIERGTAFAIDALRECPATPDEMVFLLDAFAHELDFVRGTAVDAGDLDATGLTLGGVPESARRLDFLKNKGYVVGYDDARGNPAWVAYKVFPPPSFETGARPDFETDGRTRARVSPEDYAHSGFDRGHMAPNQAMGACYGTEGQRESFLMSNIVPQLHAVNAGVWKDLEQRILKRYTRLCGAVWVVCGPLYRDDARRTRKLNGKVSVPDAFFLVIADRDEERGNAVRALAFVIPHAADADGNAKEYLVPVREIERLSGLNFFPDLERAAQDALELPAAKTVW